MFAMAVAVPTGSSLHLRPSTTAGRCMEPVWTNSEPIGKKHHHFAHFCRWCNESGTFGMAPWLESSESDNVSLELKEILLIFSCPLAVFQSTSSTVITDFFNPQAQKFCRSRLSSQHSHAMQSMAIAMGVPHEFLQPNPGRTTCKLILSHGWAVKYPGPKLKKASKEANPVNPTHNWMKPGDKDDKMFSDSVFLFLKVAGPPNGQFLQVEVSAFCPHQMHAAKPSAKHRPRLGHHH